MKHLNKFGGHDIESLEFKFVILLALLISDGYIIYIEENFKHTRLEINKNHYAIITNCSVNYYYL